MNCFTYGCRGGHDSHKFCECWIQLNIYWNKGACTDCNGSISVQIKMHSYYQPSWASTFFVNRVNRHCVTNRHFSWFSFPDVCFFNQIEFSEWRYARNGFLFFLFLRTKMWIVSLSPIIQLWFHVASVYVWVCVPFSDGKIGNSEHVSVCLQSRNRA